MRRILKVFGLILLVLVLTPPTILLLVNIIGITNIGRIYHTFNEKYPQNSETEFKLIGCVLPRTASISTKHALEGLGYTVYHGISNVFHGHSDLWDAALNDPDAMDHIIDEVLRLGYTTTMDFPSANFCNEFIKRFPDAKVLLNVRDSPEAWHKSMNKIGNFLFFFLSETFPLWIMKNNGWPDLFFKLLDIHNIELVDLKMRKSIFPWVNNIFYETPEFDQKTAKEYYERYIENIKNVTKEGNLLLFNVKDGWGPLAEFLELDEVPEEDFPRLNMGVQLDTVASILWFFLAVYPLVIVLDVLICLYFLIHICTARKMKKE